LVLVEKALGLSAVGAPAGGVDGEIHDVI
jgi:hypothetical protein